MTNFYFLISPNEYAKNLLDEIWGCFKHVGMPWNMIMSLPIQDRRAMINKHNMEQDAINKEFEASSQGNTRTYEGESLNTFARMEQNDLKRR